MELKTEQLVEVHADWLAEAISEAAETAYWVIPWAFGTQRSGLDGITHPSPHEMTRRLFEHPTVRAAITEALPEIAKAITAEHREHFEKRITATEAELAALRKLAAT